MSAPGRYDRQVLLSQIGQAGQARLAASRVLVVGCGALGSVIAESLARAGVGCLDIVDRDVVELTNLHRQTMFDESDAAAATPKAQAAAAHLQRINSSITVHPHVVDCNPASAAKLARDCDVIIDGTDNFETRFLLNDLAVAQGLPLVYGGAVGTAGTLLNVLPVTPGTDSPWEQAGLTTPCLRCVFGSAPAAGATPTCDTMGVLGR
jgi:molybdopterin/thiamine biosynthesis adenylyltransferase